MCSNHTAADSSDVFFSFLTAGERCITVAFGEEISLSLNSRVRALYESLTETPVPGISETVPTYCALSVHFLPEVIRRKDLEKILTERIRRLQLRETETGSEKVVPVYYGGETGPDLEACAKAEGISAEELIRRHTAHPYYVFQLGFSPGHPYMARFEEPFSFARRTTPRVSIPEHSVVAQKNLTNITPFSQSCGWNILGSTPLLITDYYRKEPFFFHAGDWVRLKPVSKEDYDRLRAENRPAPVPEISVPDTKGILVESPGTLTTIQDEGRFGYQAFGVTPAGPMDHRAFHLANLLAGNAPGEAALEITLCGPSLTFREESRIALAGADLSPRLNGVPVPGYTALAAHPGDLLEFGPRKDGCRAYLAVSGGIRVPEVLGSRSTDLKNRLGGYMGRALKAGDCIPIGSCRKMNRLPALKPPVYDCADPVLRVVCGPQENRFTRKGKRSFFNFSAMISDRSNRQGIRLEREPLEFVTDGNIISDGISMGAIQVANDGKPIILLADRQSVGGYAKIGTVIYADLPKLAQALPGCRLRFVEVSPELAEELYLKEKKELKKLEETYAEY